MNGKFKSAAGTKSFLHQMIYLLAEPSMSSMLINTQSCPCRFDIEGDEETQNNFPSQGHTEMPPPTVHSPPQEMEIERG